VEPCRIADTRKSSVGVVRGDTFRNFVIAGSSNNLAAQGGTVNCLNPKGAVQPVAVSAYILAVPASSSSSRGVLTAYPSDLPPPAAGSGSTVNFDKDQVIGNTTNVTVCADGSCPSDGELAILSRNTDEHVVVDIQGYYYPIRGNSCSTAALRGSWQTFVAESSVGWSSCELEINSAGNATSGSCFGGNGNGSITGGGLSSTSDCEISGSLFINGLENSIQAARMSADGNVISGILSIEGESTTFNAIRYN
jgi:hypothetical protein